jgi:hypothetical protein
MSAADKLRLRKELEKLHNAVRTFKRDDLVTGRWFQTFLEKSLGAMASAPTPPEVKAKWKDSGDADDIADDIASATIHEEIAATDAYQENLSATEVKNLKDKKPGGEQKITGDTIAIVAELLYAMKLDIDMVFNLAACYDKLLTAAQNELFEEIFARALGGFDYAKAKADGNAAQQIGAKIFDRAISQCVGTNLADAQRKGFYCFYAKAIEKETRAVLPKLPKWEAPAAKGPDTGPMMAGAEDDAMAAY